MKWIKIFQNIEEAYSALGQKEIRKVQLKNFTFLISLVDDQFIAFESLCPHQKEPLNKAKINAFNEIICPLHEYRFHLTTGNNTHGNCDGLRIYKTKVEEDGAVYVAL